MSPFHLKHNLDVAEQAGTEVSRLRAMGGSANSQLWTQIKSDVTNKPIDVLNSDTATTLGAAMLAVWRWVFIKILKMLSQKQYKSEEAIPPIPIIQKFIGRIMSYI